jgi:hypothetical protein
MAHIYNPSTQWAEAEGSCVQGQLGLYSETFSKQKEYKSLQLECQGCNCFGGCLYATEFYFSCMTLPHIYS